VEIVLIVADGFVSDCRLGKSGSHSNARSTPLLSCDNRHVFAGGRRRKEKTVPLKKVGKRLLGCTDGGADLVI